MKRLLPTLAVLFVSSIVAGFSLPAAAIEYRTVDAVTVLYDAPSQRGSKLFVIRRHTPVEVVVALDGWSKVRDAVRPLRAVSVMPFLWSSNSSNTMSGR